MERTGRLTEDRGSNEGEEDGDTGEEDVGRPGLSWTGVHLSVEERPSLIVNVPDSSGGAQSPCKRPAEAPTCSSARSLWHAAAGADSSETSQNAPGASAGSKQRHINDSSLRLHPEAQQQQR